MNELRKACLYIVPTPIGNLSDITLRAIKVLSQSDFILAEDTRKTGILLKHHGIQTRMFSHHKFNEHKAVESLACQILDGKTASLVSDAGTPGISDPGFLLIRTCIEKGVYVETLPGASALIPALVNSGLPCDRFCFEGFLPAKKGRQKRLEFLRQEPRTMIFYESPFRLTKSIQEFCQFFGNERKASVSREISKIYEETLRGTLGQIHEIIKNREMKGELVIVVAGKEKTRGINDEDEK